VSCVKRPGGAKQKKISARNVFQQNRGGNPKNIRSIHEKENETFLHHPTPLNRPPSSGKRKPRGVSTVSLNV